MSEQPTLLKQLIFFLEEMQAIDIKIIDVSKQTSVTDYMIVCSGRASRHVKAVAETAMEKMKALGLPALSANGLESGDWVLVDFGDFVLHVMQPDSRSFYNLEGLWEDTP
ncbi:ribosome silencing factor [Legionella dresdenensis]|uniref:Ribosomal silencing factor RsfS n=1 Tax=Legionella dresdenensis TaxID=450200 RepID=A0ABV8CEJ7_9GAMM